MVTVRQRRRNGLRIPTHEIQKRLEFHGDFIIDQTNGTRRLRLKNPWTGHIASLELFEPTLVVAKVAGNAEVAGQGASAATSPRLTC